jgi:hypothetical protein
MRDNKARASFDLGLDENPAKVRCEVLRGPVWGKSLRTRSASTFIWAIVSGDIATAEAQITDDVEWGLMSYNKVLKGKGQLIPWLKTAAADQKEPIVISNVATKDWGVFEYWNIGTVSEEVIKFGNQQKWPWPKDPTSFLGQKYRVAQCFTYRMNLGRKIEFIRQYLDTGSVWARLK